jgi:threonine dehydrogenase-like Zn-dependent dehydrogenase
MRIAMIGTGYVGLVSGACFADFGHQVTCVDKDGDKIASLRRGEIPIFEPGLDALVASNVKAKRLDFSTDLTAPVAEADAVFIAVGTPSRRGDAVRVHGRGHQIDRSGRDRRRGRAADPRGQSVGRIRGRLQSGVLARGCGDP